RGYRFAGGPRQRSIVRPLPPFLDRDPERRPTKQASRNAVQERWQRPHDRSLPWATCEPIAPLYVLNKTDLRVGHQVQYVKKVLAVNPRGVSGVAPHGTIVSRYREGLLQAEHYEAAEVARKRLYGEPEAA